MRHPRQGAKAYGGRIKRLRRPPPPSPYRSRKAILQAAEQRQSGADQQQVTDFFIQVGEKNLIILAELLVELAISDDERNFNEL